MKEKSEDVKILFATLILFSSNYYYIQFFYYWKPLIFKICSFLRKFIHMFNIIMFLIFFICLLLFQFIHLFLYLFIYFSNCLFFDFLVPGFSQFVEGEEGED